jgi:hypothetical protein
MKRLLIGVLAGTLVSATGVAALPDEERAIASSRQAALSAARDYLAPLVAPDYRRIRVQVLYCRDRGAWDGCRVRVTGATTCRGVLRVQMRDGMYAAWAPRMRCR